MKIHITGAEMIHEGETYKIRYKDKIIAELKDRWECIAKCLSKSQLEALLDHKLKEDMYTKIMS